MYKIKDTTTGLYSAGGMYPSFNKNGKTWRTLGHITSHLGHEDYTNRKHKTCSGIENMVIEEYELVLVRTMPLVDLVISKELKTQEIERQFQFQRDKQKQEEELAELRRLSEKYKGVGL
jgi:hypothetical protein